MTNNIKNEKEFWITNTSKLNVNLVDLKLVIKPYTSINLLDSKHYCYSLDEILKSYENGSLFKKRDKVVKRKIPPHITNNNEITMKKDAYIPSKERSIIKIDEEYYEELDLSDEKYAEENVDISDYEQNSIKKERSDVTTKTNK